LLDLGVELEIVTKSGSWFSYGSERIGQGRDSALEYIKQNPTMAADIEAKIREALRGDDFVGLPTSLDDDSAEEE
ncbi:MAG TPA: DNA recombination/repair protein RecA, partial [Fibrobacteria bacterium]|nr:DNA recombination/repair protein RecA [Fibrobacteria bacterium]